MTTTPLSPTTAATNVQHQQLWSALTDELAPVFDPHGVCAIVASKIAELTGHKIVVGLTSQVINYYDVWIANGVGEMRQARWSESEATFATIIGANAPLTQRRSEQDEDTFLESALWGLPSETILSIPLPFRPSHNSFTPPGALCIIDPDPASIFDESSLVPLANHVTTYLDRAYLRQRYVQQELEFHIVSDISYELTSTLSLEEIYNQLADPIRRGLNVESISIGLVEPSDGNIVFITELMGPLFADLPPIRLKPGQGIAGWVAAHAQPVIVNDVYDDKRFYPKSDRISGFHTHSMLCVPLKVEQRVIGVLQAINKMTGHFTEHDLRLLLAISGPVAAAIENASLHADVLAEKQRIQTIFSSMSEGMLTLDANGRVTAANDALLALLQRELNDLLGQQANEVIRLRNADFAEFVAQVMIADEEHPQLAGEIVIAPEEFLPVLLSGASVKSDEGEPNEGIIVFSDLSQIREVERMRDDFFHNIIHELRTPLATILMYARLLREGQAKDDPAKADRFLGVVERESDRLQAMVRQTLQMAKLDAREIQRSSEMVDLNALLDEIIPPQADQATQKGLRFNHHVAAALPPIYGNKETLYMIFKNLIENAVKFTLSGAVHVNAGLDNGDIKVTVRDEGIGIPDAALPNLFKRFYRASTAVERGIAGTGLGLYMVKDGVEKHQGTLEVSSVENKGTTFIVRLPPAQV